MHVTIRADASSVIGSGHVMRCLTLATALRERGASVSFLCCEHEGHRCNSIAMRGFRVHSLTAPSGDSSRDSEHAYARWLAGTSEEDAAQSRSAIESEGIRPDWIIVDHYGLDQRDRKSVV